jgi:PTS system fructose-specific IIC component
VSALITPELVALDQNLGSEPATVIRHLAELVVGAGRATEIDGLYADALAREAKTSTGIPGGLAIPHCRSSAVTEPTLAVARLSQPVDFGSADGPADLVFMIAAPEGADQDHLKILSKLARSLMKSDFTSALRAAKTPDEIVTLVTDIVAPVTAGAAGAAAGAHSAPAAAAPTGAGTTGDAASGNRRLVAVTACPTGIAHTYMAADALVAAAKEMGIDLQVETQGSAGATPLASGVIDAADAVIFAVDVDVRDKSRFAGKPVIQSPVKRAIDEPKKMIQDALAAVDNPNARRVTGGGAAASDSVSENEHMGQKIKRALLTGVSYMIPFVAGGGLLIALGFLLGGYDVTDVADDVVLQNSLWNLPAGGLAIYLGAVFFKIGALSMGFLVPALAGYIAYGIADRPGIAPGFVAGAVSGFMGAGFLGGIVGGLLAGIAAATIANQEPWQIMAAVMAAGMVPPLALAP